MSSPGADGREPVKREDGESGRLIEDTLGFNFRSLRTLADLWIRPRAVMDAVIARDRETYTPMVRLFLALIGVQVAVSVIWGGQGELLRLALAQQEAEAPLLEALQAIGAEPDAFYSNYGTVIALLHAPVVGAFTALSTLLLARFGTRRAFAVNLNLVFATLTAGSIVGLAVLATIPFLDGPPTWSVFVIAAAYFVTWVRGLPPSLARTGAGRIVKSASLTLTMIVLVLVGGTVMQLIATASAMALAAL